MKRMLFAAVALLFTAQFAAAQDWAKDQLAKSPRNREWVTIKHNGRSVDTLIAYPETKDKRPVVLVIHEIFGLSDWAQELADEVAAAGYIAVAPDLLTGMAANGGRTKDFNVDLALGAVIQLNPHQVTADLNAAADHGLENPASDGKPFLARVRWCGSPTCRVP